MSIGAAVFDFDQTLIRQETLTTFLRAIAGGQAYVAACCVAGIKAALVAARYRPDVFRSELYRRTLAGKTVAQVQEATKYVLTRLDWLGGTLKELTEHQDKGRRILVATGSLSVYVPTLLEMKGIYVDGLLSTEIVVNGNVLTGEMATPSCTGVEKARRVQKWLVEVDGPVWGYGNLPHDEAMLALTDYPTVVQV